MWSNYRFISPPQTRVLFTIFTITLSILLAGCLEQDSEGGGTIEIVNDTGTKVPYDLNLETSDPTVHTMARGSVFSGSSESWSSNFYGDPFIRYSGTIGASYVSGSLQNDETVTYSINDDYTVSKVSNDSSQLLYVVIALLVVAAGIGLLVVRQLANRGWGGGDNLETPVQPESHQATITPITPIIPPQGVLPPQGVSVVPVPEGIRTTNEHPSVPRPDNWD